MILHMLVALAICGVEDRGITGFVISRDRSDAFSVCITAANINDHCRSEFGVFLHLPASGSTLSATISDIFQLRSKEQMVRTDASRIVALMQNRLSSWNRSVVNLPTKTMNANDFAICRHDSVVVPFVNNAGSPNPAFISFVDLRPEPLLCGVPSFEFDSTPLAITENGTARPRTESPRLNLTLELQLHEGSALLAIACVFHAEIIPAIAGGAI